MSDPEKISKLEKEIKRIWPVLTAVTAIFVFAVTLAINATSTYDNKIAKKEDVQGLSKQVSELSLQISRLSEDFKIFKSQHLSDSIQRFKIKNDLEKHIAIANSQYHALTMKISAIRFFTEKKVGNTLQLIPGTK